MINSSFIGLINNAAYLLAIVLLYDTLANKKEDSSLKKNFLQGILLGIIGIAVMSTPWVLRPGAIFDTRSIVLSIGGLFFGFIPTATAMIITGFFRFFQGGIGTWTGIYVIVTSGVIGLAWRKTRKTNMADISALELYLFGFVVGLNMLLWMFTFPTEIALQILKNISLPVMLIYPLATLLMGGLLKGRIIRRQDQEALKQSEERFRAFYELNLVGLAITSPEKGWLHINQGLCSMLGYPEEELKNMTWSELTHPDDLDADTQHFEQMLAGRINGYEMEKRFIAKDGTIVFARLVVRCVRKERGEINYVVAMVEDITTAKIIEKELIRKEEQFRFLVENQRELVVSFDMEFHLLYANPAYCQTFGKAEEELAKSNFMPLIHEDDQQRVKASLQRLQEPPHSARHEERAYTVQGWRWFDWQVEATLDESGKIAATVAVGRDITVQKEAEIALAKSHEEWVNAMDFFEDAICLFDLNENILRANRAFYQLTNTTPEKSIGKNINTVLHPNGETQTCPVCRAWQEERDEIIVMESDHPDNQAGSPIEVMVRMIRDKEGKPVSVLMGIHDLTRQRKTEDELRSHRDNLEHLVLERTVEIEDGRKALINLLEDMTAAKEELRQANERLHELDRLKSMFVACMSHELRTPLNSIIGFSSILLDEWLGSVNDEQKKNLASILRSGKHLLALINDVIDISKIEAGTIEENIDNFDIIDLFEEADESLREIAESKGLRLITKKISCPMHTDRRRLLQVVLNLLSNAIKFTHEGEIHFSALLMKKTETIEIAVRDTGIGIHEADLDKLFMPFSRLHDSGKSQYPGTGLGLYLSHKITTDILGGSMRAESTVGQGSIFRIIMPINKTSGFSGKPKPIRNEK